VKVPCPNELAANQTTACAGACTQGNGTEEETAAYASCQASCISASFFPVSTTAGSGSSNTASGADSTATGESATGIGKISILFDVKYSLTKGSDSGASSTGSESGSSTASSTGASASESGSGSGAIRTAVSGAGLFGLIIAGLAL
jgi:hypothetical protein